MAREGRDHSCEELVRLASAAPGGSIVNADHRLRGAGDLPARVGLLCPDPSGPCRKGDVGALVRCL